MRSTVNSTSLYSKFAGYKFIVNPISTMSPCRCASCVMPRQHPRVRILTRGHFAYAEATHLKPNTIVSETENTITLQLSKGQTTIIDKKTYWMVKPYKWYTSPTHKGYYASSVIYTREAGRKKIYLHSHLLRIDSASQVDHINGNKLDNRLSNLRVCNTTQNSQNKTKTVKNTSGYKGVSWNDDKKKWNASIRVNGKTICLGNFGSKSAAARAYDTAARKYFGEFARLNFPKQHEQAA